MTEISTTEDTEHLRSLDDYFRDWESDAFGFGYGTGEPHTILALKAFLELIPETGGYDYQELENALGATVAWLLINILCGNDTLEYGTSPRYAWLTPHGKKLRAYVASKTADELISIVTDFDPSFPGCSQDSCNCGPHGYDRTRVCPNPFWQEKR
ncbi:hypothetical protein [Chelatococcus sp. YT9]|uniref:hypothetical protein n=1 Tax=Chelatococcus sp. YT9 TaxID=2835635 RepID=UPI001BCAC9BC|nr:hypothetical protein [Chelatococcus sp. YT9]MBS7698559.1 hypothetical protein [Chelatococcus sp. YT9]